ncbi:hypothetical protein [Streptomyces sp. T028]|uniref:hypothetical protein n=1 Tax=Streptomyces sp. T028 TaxID=3394379 RepID=UPI003A89AB66
MLRFLAGGFRGFAAGPTYTAAELNGAPAALARDGDTLVAVIGFDCGADGITGLRAVLNPDKLDFVRRQLA